MCPLEKIDIVDNFMGKVLWLNEDLFKLRKKWIEGYNITYHDIYNCLAKEQKDQIDE